jgi:hypothetical protein
VKRRLLCWSFLVLLCAYPALAQEGWHVNAESGAALGLGYTAYLYNDPAPLPYLGGRSELIFPLNTLLVGGGLSVDYYRAGVKRGGFAASAYSNITSPFGLMTDADWYLYGTYPPIAFSYSESSVDMRSVLAHGEVQLFVFQAEPVEFLVALGYRFLWLEQDILGYRLWQYADTDDNGEFELYVGSTTEKVLYYRITYHLPSLGLAARLAFGRLSLEGLLAYSLFYVSDYDDHLLRSKLSTASGVGNGLLGRLQMRYRMGAGGTEQSVGGRLHPFFTLDADYMGLRASSRQTQYWYGDDPGTTTQDETGTRITGVPHLITSKQFRLTAGLLLRY